MQVRGIDHVNIIAADLDETARFYEEVLGLRPERIPHAPAGFEGRWLYDAAGRPIIHLMGRHPERHAGRDTAGTTGAIDHVALACVDFVGMQRRCQELGIAHRVNDRKHGELRQIFLTDPNNVALELNFAGE